MVETCTLCPSSLFYFSHSATDPSEQERYDFFHKPCPACFAAGANSQVERERLCDFCAHLRLKHLVRCVDSKTRSRYLLHLRNELLKEAGDPADTDCLFCRLVHHMLVLGLGEAQLSQVKQAARHDVLLYLGVPHASKPSIPAADIYVNYGHENGVMNIWVGDLYIDDFENGLAAYSVGEMVSWAPLIDRIKKCYETHSECQPRTGGSLPPGFRVIDVDRRCLVETNNCRFVALSYVWGLTPQSKLLACSRATIDEMKKDGGLPPAKVPRTIEDAMAACIQIGERYLWADMLCIIQDDPEDLQTQVKAMGEIYPSATIVLVASYGNSMEFGIPGIGHPRNAVQQNADVAGLRVTNVLREADDDPFNVWPTRGWTYQEAVLSNRRLYFTNTRAFFECEQSICHEDPFNLEEMRDELLSTRLLIAEDMSRFDSFKRHLRHYSTRKLTYRSDAYNALFGILKSLYKGSERIIHGLPEVDFDRALLWYADIGSNAIERHETQGEVLPTWSWSSVMGLLDQVGYQATEFYGTLVSWFYVSDDSSTPGSIIAVKNDPGSIPDGDWRLYMALAYKEGCLGELSPDLHFDLKKDTFLTVQELSKTRWRDHSEFRSEAIPVTSTMQLSELPLNFPEFKKKGVIATRAQGTLLRIKPRLTYGFDIINPKGKGDIIGALCGDVTKLREEYACPGYNPDIKFEFIAVSLSGMPIRPYSQEQLSGKNYTDVDGNTLDKVPIVNMLMIGRDGNYAYRRELGWIYLVDWARLPREWKVVVLE